jgi:hypothetical protein
MSVTSEEYPRRTGSVLCQCGGELITERTTSGQLADEHDVFRVHCERCPMSSRWLCHEADCLEEIIDGMGLRRKPNAPAEARRDSGVAIQPVVRLHHVCGPTCCRTCAENCAYGNITTPCNHTAGSAGCLRDGRLYGACEHYRSRPNKEITTKTTKEPS